MDTRSKAVSPGIKNKASPSTLRRNARRREEYLQRKQNLSTVNSTEEIVSDALSCDQCDYKPASEKGLRQHKRMKHKPSQPALTSPASPERLRETVSYREALVNPMSPIALNSKQETKCAICKLDLNTYENLEFCKKSDLPSTFQKNTTFSNKTCFTLKNVLKAYASLNANKKNAKNVLNPPLSTALPICL